MLTKLPVPYDFCVDIPISRLLTVGSTPVQHSVLINSVLNVKVLVGTFNLEEALVGAFSVIVKSSRNLREGSFEALVAALRPPDTADSFLVLVPGTGAVQGNTWEHSSSREMSELSQRFAETDLKLRC